MVYNKKIKIDNLFISLLVLTFILMFILIAVVDLYYENYRAKKFEFFITLEDKTDWEIIKMTGTNYLLLKQEQIEVYKFIKDYKDLSIRAVEKK